MLVGFLITIDVIVCFLLILVVLMQSGKGGVSGAFGIGGASQTIFGAGQAGNVLTKATWILGGLFLVLSFGIALLGGPSGGRSRQSILQPAARPGTSQSPASQGGGTSTTLPPVGTPPAGGSAPPLQGPPTQGSPTQGSPTQGSPTPGSTPPSGGQ